MEELSYIDIMYRCLCQNRELNGGNLTISKFLTIYFETLINALVFSLKLVDI